MLKNADTLEVPRLAVRGLSAPLESSPPDGLLSASAPARVVQVCFHCGTVCSGRSWTRDEKAFCCQGCLTVFEILTENGLGEFYTLEDGAGVRAAGATQPKLYAYVDAPVVRERLVDFSDDHLTRLTLHLPAIHCIACVWLLENLFRLNPAIGQSQVNFPRKELAIAFDPARARLSEIISLVASLGYEPDLKLSDLDDRQPPQPRRLWLQLGFAGFAFGNTMLFSIASYLGLDSGTGPRFRTLVGILSLILALPVVFYSAADYWKSAWLSLRQRLLNIDVPIALGIAALFAQSLYEVLAGHGEGYFDSLAGLLFFLLCGKLFQQKTFDRLAFERDYRSFFPLSVTRITAGEEERVSLAQLDVGDELLVRNGELIPADATLLSGAAVVDYSFVTGEAQPVEKNPGDHVYAGGRQAGSAIHIQIKKAVSQGYLTSLWNQDVFLKKRRDSLDLVTNHYSQRFTKMVIAIALGSAAFWAWANPAVSLKAFTSVLIVACPCALALAAPFALGTAQRVLGRANVYLKNTAVLERLAQVDTVVFDKTGTLTAAVAHIERQGPPLTPAELQAVASLARHSTHPYAGRIAGFCALETEPQPVRSFREITGCGIAGTVNGQEIRLGSTAWFAELGIQNPQATAIPGSVVNLAFNGQWRGRFVLTSAVRHETDRLLAQLQSRYQLALLSGDHDRDRARFEHLFDGKATLLFQQSPADKLTFIEQLQASGRSVAMVGDGLNDAGALKQSNVGIAVAENVSSFAPASDIILAGDRVCDLDRILAYAKTSVRIVRASFLVSTLYNVIGVTIAARGLLSPVVCAILMPLSSATVVLFACGLAAWSGRELGRSKRRPGSLRPEPSKPVLLSPAGGAA